MLQATSEGDRATFRFPHPHDLFSAHRHLCGRAARRFLRDGLERCDLEQVAAIGLLKACLRYDQRGGTPFEAFAWILVVGELMHYVRDNEGVVRIPRHLQRLARLQHAARERLLPALQREPERWELARAMGLEIRNLSEVERAMNARAPAELNGNALRQEHGETIDDRLSFDQMLEPLTGRQKLVVLGIYRLGFTQAEIARRSGMSPRQVSRLHRTALNAIRRWLP